MRFEPLLLEEWLLKCRGAKIDLDHSAAPTPYGDGFDPCVGGEAWLDELELEEKIVRALAKQYKVKESSVVLTSGCQHADSLFIQTQVSPADRVVIEAPTYTPMRAYLKAVGARMSEVGRAPEGEFSIEPSALSKVLGKGAKAVLLTNLHNPSAKMLDDQQLSAILDEANRKNALVLCDEIYREMSYGTPTKPLASLGENGVSTCGLTKLWGLGGLRIGWLVGPEEVVEQVKWARVLSTYHLPARSLSVALKAVQKKAWFRERVLKLAKENLKVLDDWMEEENRLDVVWPDGALMFFAGLPKGVDDEKLAMRILKKHKTAVCPGTYFGIPGAIRVTFSCDRADFAKGLEHISSALSEMV
ncbi:MAG TPA: pyridoxal phosphate-dependent aminotransferase [Methanomassiliicoccales archaeon]|nr:pyridoxal phosphate-dependent aminotransferase [Methanomassiliicoccales archaeon]